MADEPDTQTRRCTVGTAAVAAVAAILACVVSFLCEDVEGWGFPFFFLSVLPSSPDLLLK